MKHSTLFLDESGKSSLAEEKNEPFILTGVILNESEIIPVEGFFDYIKRKYKIPLEKPFHSYHILESPSSKLSTYKANSLLESLSEFISLIPINIMVVSIDKAHFKNALGVKSHSEFKGSPERKEMREYPYRIMSSEIFKWFAKDLKKTDSIGQILADSRRGGDFQLLNSLNLCKDFKGPLEEKTAKLIKDRCTAICFADKYFRSGGLEITDLISYTSFFHAKSALPSMGRIRLNLVWNQVSKKLSKKSMTKITDAQVKKFFKVDKDGVHKYLK
jgi:hypothetical protein